jgi:hypothetical protein
MTRSTFTKRRGPHDPRQSGMPADMELDLRANCIADALVEMNRRVDGIMSGLDDSTLAALVGFSLGPDGAWNATPEAVKKLVEENDRAYDVEWIQRAAAARMMVHRWHALRAKPVLDAGGVYCVYHACDMQKCVSMHDFGPEDDEDGPDEAKENP